MFCFTLLQNGDKDIEVTDIWKRHPKSVRAASPHSAFKRWRKSAGLKLTETKSAINGSRVAVGDKGGEEDMSLLKFLAIVSVAATTPRRAPNAAPRWAPDSKSLPAFVFRSATPARRYRLSPTKIDHSSSIDTSRIHSRRRFDC